MGSWQLSILPLPHSVSAPQGLSLGSGGFVVASQLGPGGKLVGSRSSGKRPAMDELPPPLPLPVAAPLGSEDVEPQAVSSAASASASRARRMESSSIKAQLGVERPLHEDLPST